MNDLHTLAKTATITLGGRKLTLTKLTLGQWAEFSKTLRQRKVQEMLDAIGAKGPERIQAGISLLKEIPTFDTMIASDDVSALQLLLWFSLKEANPDLTEEEVGSLITMDSLPQLQATIQRELMGETEDGEDDGRKNPPDPQAGG